MLVLVASLSGCISGVKIYEYAEAEYEADENTILEVINVNGFVNVTGWDRDTIFLNIEKFTSKRYGEDEFEKVEVNVNEIDNKIIIETEYFERIAYSRVAVNLDIKVPMYVTVESVETLNGGIYLSNIKGDVQVDVKNGLISVCGVDGYVEVKTLNGPVDVKNTIGTNDISNINGIVSAEIYDFNKDIEISTVNGVMDVYINPKLDANLEIKVKSIAGFISLNDMESILNITKCTCRHVVATLGDGGDKINLYLTTGIIDIHKLES
jgi:hypothetical protein